MNKVIQIGHLCADPEVRQTKSGTAVLNCTVATSRSIPQGDGFTEEATFLEFTIWGKRAESFARFHKKGSKACLSGRLTMDEWEDRATGQKRSKVKMTVEEWEFVNGKPAEQETPF